MFSAIRKQWREARAPGAAREVQDVLARYHGLDGYNRYELTSAFEYTKDELESEYGEIAGWDDERKSAVARVLAKSAKAGWRRTPSGANGQALLSLYLELQSIPGELAKQTLLDIDNWHRDAVESDIQSRNPLT